MLSKNHYKIGMIPGVPERFTNTCKDKSSGHLNKHGKFGVSHNRVFESLYIVLNMKQIRWIQVGKVKPLGQMPVF